MRWHRSRSTLAQLMACCRDGTKPSPEPLLTRQQRHSVEYTWQHFFKCSWITSVTPDSKIHGANMGPTWVLSAPDGPHVGPMNLGIRDMFVHYPFKINTTSPRGLSVNYWTFLFRWPPCWSWWLWVMAVWERVRCSWHSVTTPFPGNTSRGFSSILRLVCW